MPAPRKCPPELRERAQRLVVEAREQEPNLSLNQAVLRIGPRVGVNPDTLRGWVKQADIDAGRRPGTTTTDGSRLKELERKGHCGRLRSCVARSSALSGSAGSRAVGGGLDAVLAGHGTEPFRAVAGDVDEDPVAP